MAVSTNSNVQIAITLEEGFKNAVPEYFKWGTDNKLHHDPRKVNVFAHKKFSAEKNLFADSLGEWVSQFLIIYLIWIIVAYRISLPLS